VYFIFRKFSDKENFKRTAGRIISVKPIHPVRPARSDTADSFSSSFPIRKTLSGQQTELYL
ncbi:MAG: hypothetical protein ACTTIT_08475, partial [Treponema sp.]